MEIFPPKLQNLWNALELRVLVLLSLFLQIVLIATGNRRKYSRKKRVAATLWISYLSADSVATLALGVLSQGENDAKNSLDPRYTIMAFWAPFLLMHLGGPDTITAYALADNELWSRHLLGLIGQVTVAIYVFLRSWISAPINYIWILVFVAGLVKYGERTWVLFSASKDRFRDSMVSDPDPGPNYAKVMDELVSKESEGYEVVVTDIKNSKNSAPSTSTRNLAAEGGGEQEEEEVEIPEDLMLQEAYSFFRTFKKLFADLILSFQDKKYSLLIFSDRKMKPDHAFRIVEIELGLVYDLFYTKAFLLYSPLGFLFRSISCLSTVGAFFAFLIIDKNVYPKTEVIITYVLLVGAIFLEIYAVLILFSSDIMMIWLTGDWTARIYVSKKFKEYIVSLVRGVVSGLRRLRAVPKSMRWSDAMGQYNVLNRCISGKRRCANILEYVEKYVIKKSESVPKGLKALIFDELKTRSNCSDEKNLGGYRGDKILLENLNYFDEDDKDHEVEFDQSLLLWHMATDFCYHADVDVKQKEEKTWLHKFIMNDKSTPQEKLKFKQEICRLLSDYMMHLLIRSPFMLPSGIGQIRFQDTCAEATEFFNKKKLEEREACTKLSSVDTRYAPSKVKGDRSKSLLFDACRLAKSLQLRDVQKWDIITQAWLDILTFAAAQCRWTDHAEKLSQGGELLTHVWLLMAHFGMTDHFQISQGYVRAKLQLA